MKRTTKNIIQFILIIIGIFAIVATFCWWPTGISSSNMENGVGMQPNVQNSDKPSNGMGSQNGNPPEMPSGSNGNQGGQPPEMPNGSNGKQGGQPPEMPNGGTGNQGTQPPEMPNGSNGNQGGKPPEMPSGGTGNQGGQPPEMPNNGMGNPQNMNESKPSFSITQIIVFCIESLFISLILLYLIMSSANRKSFKETFKNKNSKIAFILLSIAISAALTGILSFASSQQQKDMPKTMEGQASQQDSNIEYSAEKTIEEETNIKSETFESSTADKLAVLVKNSISATLKSIKVNKTGDSDGGDNTSFYGTNSGITATKGANLTIEDSEIETNATGANGIFSFGGSLQNNSSINDNTSVFVKNSKITTHKDNSGGIMTTGGGKMTAENLLIESFGKSSAAIRTDRGGGTVEVNGGTYTTNGLGSPAIYSTANVSVKNAILNSTQSEGAIIEGKNSINLESCKLNDNNTNLNGLSTTYKNIFIYQSMSGDAANGEAEFSASDCDIETNKGDSIYVTNTSATISLSNNKFKNNDNSGAFLRIQKDSWGNENQNGGNVTMNFSNQQAIGNVIVDKISSLIFNLTKASYWEGALNSENTAQNIELKIDRSSKIKLTADSYVSSFSNEDGSNSNIDFNGHKLYVGGSPIN